MFHLRFKGMRQIEKGEIGEGENRSLTGIFSANIDFQ